MVHCYSSLALDFSCLLYTSASCVGQLVCPDARGDKASLSCVTFWVGCRLHQEVRGSARTEAPSLCRIWTQAVAWREVFSKNDGTASRCLVALWPQKAVRHVPWLRSWLAALGCTCLQCGVWKGDEKPDVCQDAKWQQKHLSWLCGLQKVEWKDSAFHWTKKKNGVSALVYSIE